MAPPHCATTPRSELPLSVCVVGVGDGPWDTMNTLYEGTDARRFDNFTFVNYSEIQQQASGMPAGAFDPRFADEVLHKVPKQLQVGTCVCNHQRHLHHVDAIASSST